MTKSEIAALTKGDRLVWVGESGRSIKGSVIDRTDGGVSVKWDDGDTGYVQVADNDHIRREVEA